MTKPTADQYIAQALAYCDDDLEIDVQPEQGLPALSHAEGGCWVAAWVWVSDDEIEPAQ